MQREQQRKRHLKSPDARIRPVHHGQNVWPQKDQAEGENGGGGGSADKTETKKSAFFFFFRVCSGWGVAFGVGGWRHL